MGIIVKCFWVSLGLALFLWLLRGFAILTLLPGIILWLLLLVALVSGIASLLVRTYE